MALKIDAPKGEVKNLKFRKEGNGADGAVPIKCDGGDLVDLAEEEEPEEDDGQQDIDD